MISYCSAIIVHYYSLHSTGKHFHSKPYVWSVAVIHSQLLRIFYGLGTRLVEAEVWGTGEKAFEVLGVYIV